LLKKILGATLRLDATIGLALGGGSPAALRLCFYARSA
jgi:hypothetical protein